MTGGRALVRAGLLVTGAYFVSRVLGWVRLVVLGTTFGIQGALDPFFAAFRIPDLIFQLVAAGALASALIPTIATLLARGEADRAWRVVSTVTNLMLLALALLGGILFVFAPSVVPVITPGFDAAQLSTTVELTRLMLLSPIFLALGSVATSVLNARGRFVASVLAPIVYNLAIIGGTLFLAPSMGLVGVAVGVVAGSVLHLSIQLYSLLGPTGFRYHPRIDLTDPEARTTILLLVPRAIGLGGAQLQLLAATTIASSLAAGSISAFTIAFTVFQIPIGTLGVPLGIVALPALSERHASGATGDFVSLLGRSLRMMLFAMLPIAVVAAVAAQPIVTILFGYGKVDATGIDLTARALTAFLIALPSETAIVLLARAFYAGARHPDAGRGGAGRGRTQRRDLRRAGAHPGCCRPGPRDRDRVVARGAHPVRPARPADSHPRRGRHRPRGPARGGMRRRDRGRGLAGPRGGAARPGSDAG